MAEDRGVYLSKIEVINNQYRLYYYFLKGDELCYNKTEEMTLGEMVDFLQGVKTLKNLLLSAQ